jgi:hypothetical protein
MSISFDFDVKVSVYDSNTLETSIMIDPSNPKKSMYNLDGKQSAGSWLREPIKNKKTFDAPQLSNAITCQQEGVGSITKDSMGYIQNNANSPYYNSQFVSLFSGNFSGGHGCSVDPENFHRACAMFTARKTIKPDWTNCKDEYMVPNINHFDYKQWNDDCIIYSIFHNSSNQSSLRDLKYKGNYYNIINEWFWLDKKHMSQIANAEKNKEVYSDINNFGNDRFVFNEIKNVNLSDDAKELLKISEELVVESFKFRKIFDQSNPEYQINTWDAGWYQIRALLSKYMPDELKDFVSLFKEFELRMTEGVYKFGFLNP